MKLGKNEKHALEFVNKYEGWHTFANDRSTRNAIASLERKGFVEVNLYHMFSKAPRIEVKRFETK